MAMLSSQDLHLDIRITSRHAEKVLQLGASAPLASLIVSAPAIAFWGQQSRQTTDVPVVRATTAAQNLHAEFPV